MSMEMSPAGQESLVAWEGEVLRSYKDVAGVWTIGVGHTASAGGLKPKAGMRISKAQSRVQLGADLKKFERRVAAVGCFKAQHAFDGATHFDFNTGAIHKATWVKRYAQGDLTAAEEKIMAWVKAGGRTVKGLVNRRNAERRMIFHGDYGQHGQAEGVQRKEADAPGAGPDPVVKEAQELLTARGLNPGAIDGWMGRKTKAALLEYQKAHPHLTNDGILGPATLAQLRRDAVAVKDAATKGGGSVVSTGIAAWVAGLPWAWIVAGVAAAAVLWFAWSYRDVIARRLNSLAGRKVE